MAITVLPDPSALGAPAKFTGWRLQQDAAVLAAAETLKRFPMLVVPTGGGKSLIYMMLHRLLGARTCVLTHTKALQQQLETEFAEMGVAIAKGMNAYPCKALSTGGELEGLFADDAGNTRRAAGDTRKAPPCHVGPCLSGIKCSLRESGCHYYDAVSAARESELVVTNYAFWMHQGRTQRRAGQRSGLGDFDLLILDEAHMAPHALSEFLTVDLDPLLVASKMNVKMLDGEPEHDAWIDWAGHHLPALVKRHDQMAIEIAEAKEAERKVSRVMLDEVRTLKGLVEVLQTVTRIDRDWVVRYDPFGKVWRFTPLWPAKQAEAALFRGVPKVVLTSATVREKTGHLLGIPTAELMVKEYASGFPVSRRPVYHVPTVRVSHRMDDVEQKQWLARIDQIVKSRSDRKGIIHTVSYERARLILGRTKHREQMIGHSSEGTRAAIERFKKEPQSSGAVLVSPAVTTGYDFPYTECEYQIIIKVPFPDTRDPVLKARCEQDPDYGMYMAMQALVQMSGRGMRAADDMCETFIIDDQIKWFIGKYRRLAPDWFVHTVKTCAAFPAAPMRLPVAIRGQRDSDHSQTVDVAED